MVKCSICDNEIVREASLCTNCVDFLSTGNREQFMRDELKHIDKYMRDYEMSREEALSTIAHRNQILSFGLAAIGIVIAASLTVSLKDPLNIPKLFCLAVFVYAIPGFTVLLLIMWFGEFERMLRAAFHQVRLELRINELLKFELLSWTTRVIEGEHNLLYTYIATISMFGSIIWGVPVFGIIIVKMSLSAIQLLFPFLCGVLSFLIVLDRHLKLNEKKGKVKKEIIESRKIWARKP